MGATSASLTKVPARAKQPLVNRSTTLPPRPVDHGHAVPARAALPPSFAAIPTFSPGERPAGPSPAPHLPRLPVQKKLAIGAVDDPLEAEADALAERVMRMPEPAHPPTASSPPTLRRKCACGGPSPDGGECAECKKKREGATLQRTTRQAAPSLSIAPPVVHEVLNSGGGQALDPATREFMESRFERDFSDVRVHTGSRAAESAKSVNAAAYTVSNQVVFGYGQYRPDTSQGTRLMAHELAHVVQQGGAATASPDSRLARSGASQLIQRQDDRQHPAARRPTLGSCRPVQDDLKPSKPWVGLQSEYSTRCSAAVSDVASQAEHTLDDIFNLRMPKAPHLPDARSSVDCACAHLSPENAARSAMAVVIAAGPLAAKLFWHFLDASGTPMVIDVADMISRSSGVRTKIRQSIRGGGRSGTTRLEQHEYGDRELQFAYGAIDCVLWEVVSGTAAWRSDPATQIRVSMLDYYEFHPGRSGVSQCAHAACVESVARGKAKNFWTSGAAIVTWGDLQAH